MHGAIFLQRKGLPINSLFTILVMAKEIIHTSSAPAPIGPYNQRLLLVIRFIFPGRSVLIRQPAT
jgi:hypothetical protein